MRYISIALLAAALSIGSSNVAKADFLDDIGHALNGFFSKVGGEIKNIFKADPVKAAKFNKCHKVIGSAKVCYSDTDTGAYWKFE